MLGKSLKDMSLDELQKLLSISEKNLVLSRLHKQGAEVIRYNKSRVEEIQKTIRDKEGDHLSPQ